MNSYDLSRQWFDFAFENPELITGNHAAVYLWNVELNNRMGWVEKFASPASQSMAACGIKSYNTYKKIFQDLVEWGFISVITEAKNQYSACIIALSKVDKAPDKALDKALTKHLTKQSSSTIQSTVQSTCSINKQRNKETKKPRNQETDANDSYEFVAVEVEEIENPVSEKKAKPSSPSSAAPPSPKPVTLHARLRQEIETRNPDYYWTGKDGKALTGIINRIKYRWKNRHGEDPEEQEIIKSFIWFLDRLPQWYRDKWDTAVLSSKFDAIMSEIKANTQNGKVNNNFGNQYEPSDRLREAFELTERANAAGASKRGAFGTG